MTGDWGGKLGKKSIDKKPPNLKGVLREKLTPYN